MPRSTAPTKVREIALSVKGIITLTRNVTLEIRAVIRENNVQYVRKRTMLKRTVIYKIGIKEARSIF